MRSLHFSQYLALATVAVLAAILGIVPEWIVASAPEPNCSETADPDWQQLPMGGSEVVFSYDRIHTYALCLLPEDWDYLQHNALEKRYRRARLSIDGEKIGTVGLRYKGQVTLSSCFENGKQICPKVSMKLKFDEYDRALQLRGLKHLHFNAMNGDPSLMHEQLAYRIFREMGIPAPRTGYARLVVNGLDLGLFSIVEQIDDRYIDDRFPRSHFGHLYKEMWPVVAEKQQIVANLRTNKKIAYIQPFLNFTDELYTAEERALPEIAANWMDIDSIMRFLAVDNALNNRDGITTFWCDSDDHCGNHNFYLYEDEPHHFTIFPWDTGDTFETIQYHIPRWDEEPGDCSYRYLGDEKAPGCDPLIRALDLSDQTAYRDSLTELAQGPFRLATLRHHIDELAALIAPIVAVDPHGPPLQYWRDAVAALKDDLVFLRERVKALQENDDRTAARLTVSGVNDWEHVSTSAVTLGIHSLSPPSTSFSHRLNTLSPLRGRHDVRMDFVFRNGINPWEQWGSLRFGFAEGTHDLRTTPALRLLMSADQPRTVHVSLDSDLYTEKYAGSVYGWEVQVGQEPTLITLLLSDLSLPDWAPRVPETAQDIRASTTALVIEPKPIGAEESTGFFPTGVTDAGYVQIDEIQFIR